MTDQRNDKGRFAQGHTPLPIKDKPIYLSYVGHLQKIGKKRKRKELKK